MSKAETRGRDKHMLSPDGDKKKKNSLFRRPSLSRKKTKEENNQRRAKSRDRIENNTEGSPKLKNIFFDKFKLIKQAGPEI